MKSPKFKGFVFSQAVDQMARVLAYTLSQSISGLGQSHMATPLPNIPN